MGKIETMSALVERLSPPESVAYPGPNLGLRWRSLISSDAPAIMTLAREVDDYEDAFHRVTAQDIADMMEGAHGSDLVDTIVGVDAEGRIGAVASVRVLRGIPDQAVAQLRARVHPHWRGRGLGRALLFWQEARARQLLVQEFGADSTLPAQIMNIVDAHMTDRRRLYIAAGFYPKRTFSIMYRDIEGGETVPSISSEYSVTPWSEDDTAEAKNLHMEVFNDHYWPQMRERWWDEAMSEKDDRWSYIARATDGQVAGYCVIGRPSDRWAATGRQEAYVALIGVSSQHRGKGLLKLLLGNAIAAAARSGMTRIGLDVDTQSASNAQAIYEHYGFLPHRAEVYYAIDYV